MPINLGGLLGGGALGGLLGGRERTPTKLVSGGGLLDDILGLARAKEGGLGGLLGGGLLGGELPRGIGLGGLLSAVLQFAKEKEKKKEKKDKKGKKGKKGKRGRAGNRPFIDRMTELLQNEEFQADNPLPENIQESIDRLGRWIRGRRGE